MLKIYNSLIRDKQEFVPITRGRVRMYVCGMTVYDYCHLGHARVMVVFDIVRRWLRALDYDVTYVRNITDIDDKIIQRARENNEPVEALTARFVRAMDEDNAALGVEKPDHEPRATEHVAGMLEMIARLEQRGLAYRAPDGDVNYPVRKFPEYGKLSGKSLDDLRAGERVAVAEGKHDPLDFVLWKRAKNGEPQWDSPWGPGRPGWHIECSAMSAALLGHHFDIHGGGQDLQFPHHENEIAQSEGANQSKFVNYWMHNGFVRVDNEKMSKSLGNFFTVREVLQRYKAEVVRFFITRAHYRSPLNYSDKHLDDAHHALTRLYTCLASNPESRGYHFDPIKLQVNESGIKNKDSETIYWSQNPYVKKFTEAMNDDFNTPEAVAVLFELANEVNRSRSSQLAGLLKTLGGALGLLQQDSTSYLQSGIGYVVLPPLRASGTGSQSYPAELIEKRIEERNTARKSKNFAEADRIRQELLDAGVVLEDTPRGTLWRRN